MPRKRNSSPAPDYDSFRQRLAECVSRVGSTTRLAKAAGIPQSTIRGYAASVEPSRDKIISIARAAGVSPAWLLDGSVSPTTAPDAQSSPAASDREAGEQELVYAVSKLFDVPFDRAAARLARSEEIFALVRAAKQSKGFVELRWLNPQGHENPVVGYLDGSVFDNGGQTAGVHDLLATEPGEFGKAHFCRGLSARDLLLINPRDHGTSGDWCCFQNRDNGFYFIRRIHVMPSGEIRVHDLMGEGMDQLFPSEIALRHGLNVVGRVVRVLQLVDMHQAMHGKFGEL